MLSIANKAPAERVLRKSVLSLQYSQLGIATYSRGMRDFFAESGCRVESFWFDQDKVPAAQIARRALLLDDKWRGTWARRRNLDFHRFRQDLGIACLARSLALRLHAPRVLLMPPIASATRTTSQRPGAGWIALKIVRATLLPLCALATLPAAAAQATSRDTAGQLLAVPARNWAIDCAANEILVIQHPNSYLRYRMHAIDEKGDQVRDQIETKDGSVARLVLRDGRPLTPDEDAAERNRLTELAATPSDFYRHINREQANKKLGADLLKMMPDAMLWTYAPDQPQLPEHSGAPQVVLDFTPNPDWTAPSMSAEPLTGLRGRVWIDSSSRRMLRLEGDLFHAVNVGFGMLAHIYPGGKITLQQVNAEGQRWIVEHIVEQLTVRALMVKTVKQRLVFDTSSFQPISPMRYQDAIKLLLDTPLPH